jgi:hypothetical protein
MSIRETSRNLRDRWPLQFDLEGLPRDTATREARLRELRGQNDLEINPMNIPQVKNQFASDNDSLLDALTPAQKQKLLKELLASNQGGQEFDLSKPPVAPYRFQEFPKAVWTPDGKKQVLARSKEHEEQLVAAGHSVKPPVQEEAEPEAQVAADVSEGEVEAEPSASESRFEQEDRPRRRR